MRWFEGEISSAIDISKTQNSLFVVFVGEDEGYEIAWNNNAICATAEGNKCICLNIKPGSELACQFSKIYPIKYHPTVYFIGNYGKPLLVKVGKVPTEELMHCFTKAIELHERCSIINDSHIGSDVQKCYSEEEMKTCLPDSIDTQKLSPEEEVKKCARIQFKLPDGSHLNKVFLASDSLFCAHSFVLQNLSGIYRDVSFSLLHPKKTFIDEDYNKTFMELNLTPSAIIIVLPKKLSPTCMRNRNVLMSIFCNFLMLWQILVSFIFPNRRVKVSNYESLGECSQPSHISPNIRDANQGIVVKKLQSVRSKKEGKIHGLAIDDKDDEQATWNGNSTQQM